MSGSEDDAIAPTIAGPTVGSLGDHVSRLDRFVEGSAIGRYQLKARLGAGAMGVVWSARDPQLDRDVAIKLVHPDLASEESSSRLLREARAMAKLSHRSVITVHDAGEADGTLFLAMELVRGTTLGQILRKRSDAEIADWKHWLEMMLEAGRGLAEAHRNGVLHRDFKPDNVLVDGSGRVCVGDFGLAALGERVASRQSTPVVTIDQSNTPIDLTSTGQLLGTPVYMSPQQLSGEDIDARADQFAFCVALYEAMYGKRPFYSESGGMAAVYALIAQIIKGPPKPPADSPVPPAILEAITRGLAVEPAARWPDIDALIAVLEQALRGKAALTGAMPRRRPSRLPWIAGGGVAAAAAATVIYLATRSSSPSAPPPSVEHATPRKLFGMALRTRMGISPDGKRIGIGGDALWVRNIDGGTEWKAELPTESNSVSHLELDDRDVVFSLDGTGKKYRWHYATDNKIVIDGESPAGIWVGTTVAGDIVRTAGRSLSIVGPGGVAAQPLTSNAEVLAISPDRRRVAFVEGGRFTGTLGVYDVTTRRTIRSVPVDEPVALTWLDNTTLIFATSTLHEPRIQRAVVDADTIGPATEIYGADTGWFSDLGVGDGKLFFVSMPPEPTGRVVELGTTTRDDLGSVSLGLGWDRAGDLVLWNRGMHDVERQTYPKSQLRPTTAKLAVEPANATLVGDTLIATLRRPGGRQAVAISLVGGDKPLWEHPDKRTLAVRCAGDREPPCFALRNISEDLDRVVTIDPVTGTLGTESLIEQERIEDIAVRADGKKVMVVGRSQLIREVDVATHAVEDIMLRLDQGPLLMSMVRSAAYASDGTMFVAGTVGRNRYQVGRVKDGVYTKLDDLRDGLTAFVRPSPDGTRVVFVIRRYAPTLFELPL